MASSIKMQVVGFPLKLYRRLMDHKPLWESHLPEGTAIRYVPSRHDYLPLFKDAEVNQIAANLQDDYVHIATLPSRTSKMLEKFRFDCRIIKLDVNGDFTHLAAAELSDALTNAVDYEQRWCAVVKPSSPNHPLWLPRPSFEVDKQLCDYWARCDCYKKSESLTEANNLIQSVVAKHRYSQVGRGMYWIDVRAKEFSVDRSGHGRAPGDRAGRRRFRFASEVPHGFHFDVVHCERKKFSITSCTQTHHNCLRANVDPWGVVLVRE